MGYLKIIFYGMLALFERRPLFCIIWLTILIVPPILWPVVRWIMLGIFLFIGLIIFLAWWKIRRLKRKFEKEYSEMMRNNGASGAGFSGFSGFSSTGAGFSAYGFQQGMTLEDFVRQMQAQADARQGAAQQQSTPEKQVEQSPKQSDDEYVDFEEIK